MAGCRDACVRVVIGSSCFRVALCTSNSGLPDAVHCVTCCCLVQVFAEHKVEYVYQPLGIIVAETPALAAKAASLVAVQYSHSAVRFPSLVPCLSVSIGSLWQHLGALDMS